MAGRLDLRRHTRALFTVVVLVLALLENASAGVQACQPHAADILPGIQILANDWSRSGHALAGKVWLRGSLIAEKQGSSCDHHPLFDVASEVSAAIKAGGTVLLGEVHDNPGHHRLRAEIIGGHMPNAEENARLLMPGLVLEHIRADQQTGLDEFNSFNRKARRLGHAGDLFRFLEWDKSGWPDKKIFEPLMTAAINAKLPILAGDPPRDLIRKVAREGEAAIAPEERARLKLDVPLEPPLLDALLTELEASHCGMMPKTAFGNMAFAQRYRDAHLANAVLAAAETQGAAFLLAGNGHVRTDRGVPLYLRLRAPERKVLSIMLIEVEDGKTDPEAYGLRDAQGQPIADFVVLTPRQARPDPCEKMRDAKKAKRG